MGRTPAEQAAPDARETGWTCAALCLAAAALGLGLLWGSIWANSATYDETTYLRVAARWWRTGQQDEITRMGSPLSFWKLQQAPVFWLLDQTGRGALIDDAMGRQAELLPLVRVGVLWIWAAAWALCVLWSRLLHGPRAMVLAAWLFALSPNLLAHGALVTMELPLVACTTGMLLSFWLFLTSGRTIWFWASAALGGLAFSCKYTTVLFPLILAVAWWWEDQRGGGLANQFQLARKVVLGMAGYLAVMALANLLFTGFALLPLSPTRGGHPSIDGHFPGGWRPWITALYETPLPQDWVGLVKQINHQMSGGPSYLLGERRLTGWRSYYFIALAVKTPLAFWPLFAGRMWLVWKDGLRGKRGDSILPVTMVLFLTIAALGSSRNYGVRYLLPLFPLAIVWVSRLAESIGKGRFLRLNGSAWLVAVALAGQALAVASVHPYELTYFNALAGGPVGGRRVLADSNLDWGQGLKALAALQQTEPEYRDLTLFYFGDTEPRLYGVEGTAYVLNAVDPPGDLPELDSLPTRYLAVSASLQWGPWGPPGFFTNLNAIPPVRFTADTTIAIYRVGDLQSRRTAER